MDTWEANADEVGIYPEHGRVLLMLAMSVDLERGDWLR